jgi:ABC-type multidrug transport system ATPase subunit
MTKDVVVQDLSKRYGSTQALSAVSFEVNKGELYGFIGPDGGGKTTLFRILTTLLLADKGTAHVGGLDVVKDYRAIRNLVGYMPGKFSLYQDLSVEENLSFFATIFGTSIRENYYLIKDIYSQIEPFKKRRAGQLSGGMKQKLALSCALIHKPQILFLDEPTTGVDAVSRKEFWEMLKRLQENQITIVVSTPYMDEADLCDRVSLIQQARILMTDTPSHIVTGFTKEILAIKGRETYRLIKDLEAFPEVDRVYPFGEYLHYTGKHSSVDSAALKNYLEGKGHAGVTLEPVTPGIEDCFIALTGTRGGNGN